MCVAHCMGPSGTEWGKRGTSSGRRKWGKIGRRQQIGGRRENSPILIELLKEIKEIKFDGLESRLKVLN